MKYSKNKKLNAVLTGIEEQIIYRFGDGDRTAAVAEAARYKAEFPKEPDYNIAQYGNLLVYYADIYNFYRECGYKSTDRMSSDRLWETYLRQVGYVVREMLKEGRIDSPYASIFDTPQKRRCRDCAYLIEGDNKEWVCDCCGKDIHEIHDNECYANQSY